MARAKPKKTPPRREARPRLLAGGNPQIAKGDGDAPVQAYLAAMPGWKRSAAASMRSSRKPSRA